MRKTKGRPVRTHAKPWAGTRKKTPKKPSFKHAVIVEIGNSGIVSIRSTVPGMTVITLDHDAPDDIANFNASGSICQRIVTKADRARRSDALYLLGPGDGICAACERPLDEKGKCIMCDRP